MLRTVCSRAVGVVLFDCGVSCSPMLVNFVIISFRLMRPRLLIFSRSACVLAVKSAMVVMLALFKQLLVRVEKLSWLSVVVMAINYQALR